MNCAKFLGAMFALMCASSYVASAFADIPPRPRDLPQGKIPVQLVVKTDPNKDMSFLRLSRQSVNQAAAPNAKDNSDWSPSATRSIIAAIAMSAGIAGAFFVRGRKRLGLAAAALVAGTVMLTYAVQSFGNAAPQRAPPRALELPADFNGSVVVEIIDKKDFFGAELIIGTKMPPERRNFPNFGQPVPQQREAKNP